MYFIIILLLLSFSACSNIEVSHANITKNKIHKNNNIANSAQKEYAILKKKRGVQ